MELNEYRKRAQALLEQLDNICANPSHHTKDFYNLDIEDWTREFRHLVYSYDRLLPLNKELEKDDLFVVRISNIEESAKIKKCIEFFIHYLDFYGCEQNTNV